MFKIISTFIGQNPKFFLMHVLKKDVLLLGTKGLFIGYVAMATIAFQNGGLIIKLRGCLHESGLSFNPDRTHSVSVEIIGD